MDAKVRAEFKVNEHPLHLWERYYIGDADENILLKIAKYQGFNDISELFSAMDRKLIELCEELANCN